MVWGCINSRGVGQLKKVEGRLNASAYIDLLKNFLIPSIHSLSMPRDWIFQQDNATCHTARTARAWFDDNDITVMSWPMQSPDLNPIENLLDLFGMKVHKLNPRNLQDLWTAVQTAWDALSHGCLKTLFESMPRRCDVIDTCLHNVCEHYYKSNKSRTWVVRV